MKKNNPLAGQVSSLLKITGAKLKQAKEAEPADLGSTVIRECLSALNSATAILDRLESEELAMAPPVAPAPKKKPGPKPKPVKAPAEKAPARKPVNVPKLKVDASDMEV